MTYLPSAAKEFATYTKVDGRPVEPAQKAVHAPKAVERGFWARIYDAIWIARQRQADAEIARYLSQSGGKLTDDMEREISRRLGSENFRLR